MYDEEPQQHDSRGGRDKGKFAGAFQPRRQRANEDMVDKIRTYGIMVVAALVLLPPQLVAAGLAIGVFVYAWIKYVWQPLMSKQRTAE